MIEGPREERRWGRVLRVADYDDIEKQVRERIKNQLIPEAKVEMNFERRRPPLDPKGVSPVSVGSHHPQLATLPKDDLCPVR